MAKSKRHRSNEWEFQGQVLTWLNNELQSRKGMRLEKTTQEPSKVTPKRSDLVVWKNRASDSAFLTFELKTPETSILAPRLLADADAKAKSWNAPYFAIWNMQSAELYQTPPKDSPATPAHRLYVWPPDTCISTVDDWLKREASDSLRARAIEILDSAWERHTTSTADLHPIEPSVFVERLGELLRQLRNEIHPVLAGQMASDRTLRKKLRSHAAAQGFLGFVDDLNLALGGQYAYRLIGQILFYFALRRKQPALPELSVSLSATLPKDLWPYWAEVRRFDYEALFAPSELDREIPVPQRAQEIIKTLINYFSRYDWNSLRDDVLGAIFERLIPRDEQHLLGQFYTPARVADLLVAFTVGGENVSVLDPGRGSGTFLMRAYDLLKAQTGLSHNDLLTRLWGFDISAFASELAAINLFRQDMSEFYNFPRIVPRDFFDRVPGERIPFLPARSGGVEKVSIEIPKFSAVIGNPPYLRSQNQDDLDKNYKVKLFHAALRNGIRAASKTDLFAFFIYKALEFMRPGSRIGFVTSASWLTAEFGAALQRLLLEKLRLVAVIGSNAESFFSQVDVNTVLLVAEMREKASPGRGEYIRFVTLKKRLEELFPSGIHYWSSVVSFADRVEGARDSAEDDAIRIKVINAAEEALALPRNAKLPRNWSLYLRAPLCFYDLFGELS